MSGGSRLTTAEMNKPPGMARRRPNGYRTFYPHDYALLNQGLQQVHEHGTSEDEQVDY
mgnify:CR=1 FL=1